MDLWRSPGCLLRRIVSEQQVSNTSHISLAEGVYVYWAGS